MHKRLWLALAWLLGCGDDDEASGPSNAALACARGCARAAAANCANQARDCQQRCVEDIAATPAGCIAAVSAYATCAGSTVWSCDGAGSPEATFCSAQLAAWVACANGVVLDASIPGDDAGLSCEIGPSDLACDQCLKQQCCASLSACDAECVGILSCNQECVGDCSQSCAQQHPQGLPGVQEIFACMQLRCAVACADQL